MKKKIVSALLTATMVCGMVNMGSDEIYTDEIDEWTVRTEDGLPSAQWEVTVLVTETMEQKS